MKRIQLSLVRLWIALIVGAALGGESAYAQHFSVPPIPAPYSWQASSIPTYPDELSCIPYPGGANKCAGFNTCVAQGSVNVCRCTPKACPANSCGIYPDGCGSFIDCGGCSNGNVCGGQGTPGVCAVPLQPTPISSCQALQSNKNYALTADIIGHSGNCFVVDGSGGAISHVVLDGGQHKIQTTGAAVLIQSTNSNRVTDVLVRNAVVDSPTGILIQNKSGNAGVNIASCAAGGTERIGVTGNTFVQGDITVGGDSGQFIAQMCNVRVEANDLGGQGNIEFVNRIFGTGPNRALVGTIAIANRNVHGLVARNVNESLFLGNEFHDIPYDQVDAGPSTLDTNWHLAFLFNSAIFTSAIPNQTNTGKTPFEITGVEQSVIGKNIIYYGNTQPNSDSWLAVNTYKSHLNEYMANTFISDPVSLVSGASPLALNFRSGGNDNLLYRNTFLSYGTGLKFLEASSPVVIDLETGTTGDGTPHRNIIDSNTIIGSVNGVLLENMNDGNVFKNNKVKAAEGFNIDGGCSFATGSFITVVNNTFDVTGYAVGFHSTESSCAVHFHNNILASSGTNALALSNPNANTLGSNNLLFSSGTISVPAYLTASQTGDPLFANKDIMNSQNSYALTASSTKAIDKGSASVFAGHDFSGGSRPAGASPDIGAYEYGSSSCLENWSCGAWSSCSGGQKTRVCSDSNNCGTVSNKPITVAACSTGDTLAPSAPAGLTAQ